MPDPIITPVAQWSSSVSGTQPESSTASDPATIARWMKRSIFFWSLIGIHSLMSRPPVALVPAGTCPATLQGESLASNTVMAPMPDSALINRRQTCSTPTPRGQAMPMPVTTTRRITTGLSRSSQCRFLLLLLFDIVDRVLDGGDLLRRVLGDLDVEFFLECHHQFDRVQAVGTQVVDE